MGGQKTSRGGGCPDTSSNYLGGYQTIGNQCDHPAFGPKEGGQGIREQRFGEDVAQENSEAGEHRQNKMGRITAENKRVEDDPESAEAETTS